MATPDSPQSFNPALSSYSGPPGPPPATPHRPLYIHAALGTLKAAAPETQRKVIARWLRDNIVSLVGEQAADTLEAILNVDEPRRVDTFVGYVLEHRMNQEK